MQEKVVLVTGGSRGIGESICKMLANAGYFVYINVRRINELSEAVLQYIISNGGNGKIIEFDVSNIEEIKISKKYFKHNKLDLLVNNAGITQPKLLYEINIKSWENILQTNFFGAIEIFHEYKNELLFSNYPVVISIGSMSGVRPRKGQGGYPVSKSMLIEWTKQQAKISKNNQIRFYTISPGPVATDMVKSDPWYKNASNLKKIPLGRFAEPEEIAEMVLLLSEGIDILENGSNIILDGGYTRTINSLQNQ